MRKWMMVTAALAVCAMWGAGGTRAADLRTTLLDEVGRQTRAVRRELLALKDLDAITTHCAKKRALLMRMNAIDRPGPMPVNARVTGTIDREWYRVEKVVFESAPGILVPANIYVPKNVRGRMPAVLCTEGHSAQGKRGYQSFCLAFVSQGYIAMTFDPMGQGERGIYYDRASGNEHVSAGLQAYCAGMHMSALFIGDGLYAVDYLLSRDDVDPKRIAVTGNSGGGAQALYLGALDPRIAVSIPSCFTTLDSMVVAITATHPESNYFGAFRQGITMETLCAMTAPRGLLINASKEDFFPIEGTRVVHETARRVYAAAGVPGNIAMFEGEGGHAYTGEKLEVAVRFLARMFGTEAKPLRADDPIPWDRLDCSTTGNIEDDGSRTLFDLVRDRALELADGRAKRVAGMSLPQVRRTLTGLLGITDAAFRPEATVTSDGTGPLCRTVTFEYAASDGFPLSGELFLPREGAPERLTVVATHLSEFSSSQVAGPYIEAGEAVFIPRPRGTVWARYEKDGIFKLGIDNRDYYFAMGAFNAGRTVVGIQATDIMEGTRAALGLCPGGAAVRVVGDELLAPASVAAAVLLDGVDELVVVNGLWGYEAVATHRVYEYYTHPELLTIRGLLEHFDLAELALAPRFKRVVWRSPRNQDNGMLYGREMEEFAVRLDRLATVFGMKDAVILER